MLHQDAHVVSQGVRQWAALRAVGATRRHHRLRRDHPDKVIVQLFGLRAAAATYKRRLIQQRANDRCVGLLKALHVAAVAPEGIVQHFVA